MSFATSFRLSGTAVLLTLILIATSSGQGRAEEIRLDEVKIPVIIPGSSRPASVALEAIVLRPDDGLPHPLAVLNHAHREMRATAPR
jgi:hypothetical protein